MSVTRHADPRAFLAAAAPLVARSDITASALTAWTQALIDIPPPADERIYLATYAGDGAFGAAMQRRDGAVYVGDSDAVAAQAFARDLAAEWPQLQGVAGLLASCEAFAQSWKAATGRVHRVRFHLLNHVLTDVVAVPAPGGAMRNADAGDLEWLAEAQVAFIADARLPDNPADVRIHLAERIVAGRYRIWQHCGPVAFAGWFPSGADAARIAPVWTAASARRRGYATALVAALARELLDHGRRSIYLDTDAANPTSNAIYARVGFRPLRDFYHFDFVLP